MLFGTPVNDNVSVSKDVQCLKRNYTSGTPVNVSCTPVNDSGTPITLDMLIMKG